MNPNPAPPAPPAPPANVPPANNQQGGNPQPNVVPAPLVFATNPYSADINPATTQGMKLFVYATSPVDSKEKLDLTIGKQVEIINSLREYSAKFAWGKVISAIPVSDVVNAETKDILYDLNKLSETLVRQYTNSVFHQRNSRNLPATRTNPHAFDIDPANDPNDRPIFYQRVRLTMIGQFILGLFSKAALNTIVMKKHLYTWRSTNGDVYLDGALMLQIIMDHINPSTRVGVTHLKDLLRDAKLSQHNNNVLSLTEKMDSTYQEILNRGGSHDDYIKDLFEALLSGKNDIFNKYIQDKKTAWETGTEIESHRLIQDAVTVYNNMYVKKTWNQKNKDEDKIVALTTQLNEMKEKLKGKDNDSSSSKKDKVKIGKYEIAAWRIKKSFGDSVDRDGKTYYWCPKHMNGDGMYVTHKPEDHGKNNRRKKDDKDKGSDKSNKNKQKALTLSDKMKSAMVTRFKCSDEEAKQLWSEICDENTDF